MDSLEALNALKAKCLAPQTNWSYFHWQTEVSKALDEIIAENVDPRRVEDSAWGTVYLHSNWRYITSQMTTPERERAADAVERWNVSLNADDPYIDDMDQTELRWWRD